MNPVHPVDMTEEQRREREVRATTGNMPVHIPRWLARGFREGQRRRSTRKRKRVAHKASSLSRGKRS